MKWLIFTTELPEVWWCLGGGTAFAVPESPASSSPVYTRRWSEVLFQFHNLQRDVLCRIWDTTKKFTVLQQYLNSGAIPREVNTSNLLYAFEAAFHTLYGHKFDRRPALAFHDLWEGAFALLGEHTILYTHEMDTTALVRETAMSKRIDA
jgi:hypothetical protein